jgi:hypothetical protein
MFEFVPELLEPFPIGKDLDAFADCGNNIDFFDRFKKAVSLEPFATHSANRGQFFSHCNVVGLGSLHALT